MDFVLSFLSDGLLGASWWQIVAFTLIVTHITILGVTIYLHRSQAHRGLDMHPAVAHFFRLAVADHWHGHQGVGGHPLQAPRPLRT